MRQSMEILKVFNTLTLKQIFCKTKTFFKKLEYRFLLETTKIENASFPKKTAMSGANVKTNRIGGTKWIYHKKRTFTSIYLIFLKILFQFKNLLQSILCTSYPNVHIHTFSKRESFIEGAFSL